MRGQIFFYGLMGVHVFSRQLQKQDLSIDQKAARMGGLPQFPFGCIISSLPVPMYLKEKLVEKMKYSGLVHQLKVLFGEVFVEQ